MSTRTRLDPGDRRSQLLDLGVRLLSTRSLDEISIDALAREAGISRGLLYHYFGSKQAFREAVVRRAAAALVEQVSQVPPGEPVARVLAGVRAYVDFVDANYEGYLSLVRAAKSGDETLKDVYEDAFHALTELIFAEDSGGIIPDTAEARLLVRGWQAMTEELVLSWKAAPADISRDRLLELIAGSLPAVVASGAGMTGSG